jgi:hypothetical protein
LRKRQVTPDDASSKSAKTQRGTAVGKIGHRIEAADRKAGMAIGTTRSVVAAWTYLGRSTQPKLSALQAAKGGASLC